MMAATVKSCWLGAASCFHPCPSAPVSRYARCPSALLTSSEAKEIILNKFESDLKVEEGEEECEEDRRASFSSLFSLYRIHQTICANCKPGDRAQTQGARQAREIIQYE